MRVLLDACVWGQAALALRDAGYEVDWVGAWDRDPGDVELMRIAREGGLLLVTLDKDFGELAIVRGVAHCGILRLVGIPARLQGPAAAEAIRVYGDLLREGGLVTVEVGRVRVRPSHVDDAE